MNHRPTKHPRRTPPTVDPDFIAIQALTFIAGDPERLGRFIGLSGIAPADLRGAAADPAFLLGVMDYVVADEPLLLLVAAEAGVAPEAVVEAHDRMTRRW